MTNSEKLRQLKSLLSRHPGSKNKLMYPAIMEAIKKLSVPVQLKLF